VTKVYPVGDLVLPITSGMGMMGGMGGMFAVEDDLTLGVKKKPAAGAPVASQPARTPRRQVSRIKLDVQPGETVQNAWDRYFDTLKDASADEQETARARVRETARGLMKHAERLADQENEAEANEKYNEVVTLLQAALRHGFPQTWMYEAMGLAMQASGAPAEDVERALMSVVDFATCQDDILIVAEYMTHLDLDRRALDLFRNVATAQPLRPEPYLRGLAAAQRLEDVDGIKWACIGILSRAWPKDQQKIGENAYRVARATYEQLVAEKRTEEAERFKEQGDQAMVRDCVIKVTWTGDADIDLLVEEPAGTVCSAGNPHTTGGGVMLGDNWARLGGESPDGYSEYYVCPEGFSGQYRMMIKRIWGKPTAGKVTVEVATNYGSDKQQYLRKQVPLGEKNAAVVFELKEGRRKDPLDAQQIANVARAQEAIGRAVLAQQLAAYEGSDAVRDYFRGWQQAIRDGRLPGRRGVGVRPVITVLPEGTNFSATAVISADRRYVRVTPMPMFSGVGEVTTFTFSGPAAGGGQGGQGGGGFGGGGGGFGGGGGGRGGGGFSDQRLKTNTEPLEYGLTTVNQLNPVRFNWAESVEVQVDKLDGTTQTQTIEPSKWLGDQDEVGLLAQEVEELVPEIVSSQSDGLKRLNYDKLVPVLIKAVQELSAENEQLKSDIGTLKARLDDAGM